jgi:hypothetical protein
VPKTIGIKKIEQLMLLEELGQLCREEAFVNCLEAHFS